MYNINYIQELNSDLYYMEMEIYNGLQGGYKTYTYYTSLVT